MDKGKKNVMDNPFDGELSLLDVVNEEQLNLPLLKESPPLFSRLCLPNIMEPLTPVLEEKLNFAFDVNTVMENQSYDEKKDTLSANSKEKDSKAIDQNCNFNLLQYFIQSIESN